MKYRADIAAIGESRWSNNAMEYDTPEEVKEWLDGLATRWFGYDMARVVPVDTPRNEEIKPNEVHQIGFCYQNFRRS